MLPSQKLDLLSLLKIIIHFILYNSPNAQAEAIAYKRLFKQSSPQAFFP